MILKQVWENCKHGKQQDGIEATIYAMLEIYHKNDCETVLLIDAKNVFNSKQKEKNITIKVEILCQTIA